MHITILTGGDSEREVSILSGKAVKKSLLNLGHQVDLIDIKNSELLSNKYFNTDMIFNALHGGVGENGIIQSICEINKIPYTGSGVLASALAMNKVFSKLIFKSFGINVPEGVSGIEEEIISKNNLNYPFIVKPIDGGSSIGIKIIKNKKDIDNLKLSNKEVILEPFIEGREVSVAVFNKNILGMIEINFSQKIYDYEAKYYSANTEYVIPKDLNNNICDLIYDFALKAHDALGCKGLTRADFRLDSSNNLKPFILEINTLPGLTEHSLVPKIAKNAGINFDELILMIIEDALN